MRKVMFLNVLLCPTNCPKPEDIQFNTSKLTKRPKKPAEIHI